MMKDPKLTITLTTATDRQSFYAILIDRNDNDTEAHLFAVTHNESDDVSGKKKMMDFISEITAQFAQDLQL